MTNVLLQNLKLPGVVCRLPSQGLLYSEGVLASHVTNGEVEVKAMSAFEEISMRNISDIINGNAVSNVFKRCIPDILKPEELFSKDVDLLLVVLRQVTYGSNITISHNHQCKGDKSITHKYDVDLSGLIKTTKYIDPTIITESYTVPMDNGQIVMLHPIKFKDYLELMQSARDYDSMTNTEMQEKLLVATVNVIKSVDGIDDYDSILEWTKEIPAPWFTKISKALNLSNDWGFENSTNVVCKDCKKPIQLELPLNPLTFFLES